MVLLNPVEMCATSCGTLEDVAVVACGVVGVASPVYACGLLTNWWNPVGWISAVLTVADVACIGFEISQVAESL